MKTKLALKIALSLFALGLSMACSKSSSSDAGPTVVSKDAGLPSFALIRDLASSATSTDTSSSLSFNVPIPTLSDEENEHHIEGDALFSRKFNTEGGVGPAFNSQSCVACHARDGRGALPQMPVGQSVVRLGSTESLLLRISLETATGTKPVPGYTEQIFHRGVYDLRPDSPGSGQADIDMSFETSQFTYPDGRTVQLRKPVFKLVNGYDAVGGGKSALEDPDLRISPRIGPPMIGLGLLEAIDPSDILALADPDDTNQDGISGRPNTIDGRMGRFGWKANNVSVRTQVAAAFSNDMGIRSSLFPIESISGTPLLEALIRRLGLDWKPLDTELPDTALNALEFYTSTLAVPQRRNVDLPEVKSGARTFETIGCASCHNPHFRTSQSLGLSPSVRGLEIYPFSDELLHDMGPELADNRPDHQANGREWKTRPLWGIGKTQTINPRAGFLHDGRARNLEEAILHHGGEAAVARSKFANLNAAQRQELVSFLLSL